jgi:hypothetical protein
MNAADKPQLDQKWWDKNKGKLIVKETGLGKLLLAYELAEEKRDRDQQLHALGEIQKAIPGVVKLCAIDKDTVTVLNKFPHLIDETKKEVLKKQAEEKAAAAKKPLPVPPQKASKPLPEPPKGPAKMVVLWSGDFGNLVKGRVPWLQMKGYKIEVKASEFMLDVMEKEAGSSPLNLLHGTIEHTCTQFAEAFAHAAENIAGDKKSSFPELQKKAQDLFQSFHPKLQKELEAIPMDRFNKVVTDKAIWKAYKMEVGVDIAIGTLQIVAGALAIAAAVPTMGATLPLAVLATARGIYGTTTKVVAVLRTVESDQAELRDSIHALVKIYLDQEQTDVWRARVQEGGAAVLKGLLGGHAPFIESVDKCNGIYKRWKPKVSELRLDHANGLNGTNQLLKETEELMHQVEKSKGPEAVKTFGKVKVLRQTVNKNLEFTSDLGARIVKAESFEKQFEANMTELNSANPNYMKLFTQLFPAAVSIGLAAGTGGLELSHAESALETAKAALQMSQEIANTAREAAA